MKYHNDLANSQDIGSLKTSMEIKQTLPSATQQS